MPAWGQLVCGPPGSGKTTYTRAIHEFLNAAGRPTIIVNLDPANDSLPYQPDVNIFDLVSLDEVAEAYKLGPNGGLVYCLEYLQKNLDWLEEKLAPFRDAGYYFLFDCPGQAELYTHHDAFFRIVQRLMKLQYNLVAVHLVDAHHCSDAGKFISAALLSLTAMIRLEMPHVNVLSKVDMMQTIMSGGASDRLARFDLDDFTDISEISHLAYALRGEEDAGEEEQHDESAIAEESSGPGRGSSEEGAGAPTLSSSSSSAAEDAAAAAEKEARRLAAVGRAHRRRFRQRYAKLNEKIVEIIEDHSLVAFVPLSLQEPERIVKLIKFVDRAGGYVPLKPSGSAKARADEAAARIHAHADLLQTARGIH